MLMWATDVLHHIRPTTISLVAVLILFCPATGLTPGWKRDAWKGRKSQKNLIVLKFGRIHQSSLFFFFSSSATVVLRKIFSSTRHAVWLCIGLHAKDWLWEIEASEFPCGYLCNLARQKMVLSKLAGVVWNKKGESRFSRPELEKWWWNGDKLLDWDCCHSRSEN